MINEILSQQLDNQVSHVKRQFSEKIAKAEPGTTEAWAALFEHKIKSNFSGTARKTEFSLRYGLAKTIINEIR